MPTLARGSLIFLFSFIRIGGNDTTRQEPVYIALSGYIRVIRLMIED